MDDYATLLQLDSDPAAGLRGLRAGTVQVISVDDGVTGGADALSFAEAMGAYLDAEDESPLLGSLLQGEEDALPHGEEAAPLELAPTKGAQPKKKVVVLGDLVISEGDRAPTLGELLDDGAPPLEASFEAAADEATDEVAEMFDDVDVRVTAEDPFISLGPAVYSRQEVE